MTLSTPENTNGISKAARALDRAEPVNAVDDRMASSAQRLSCTSSLSSAPDTNVGSNRTTSRASAASEALRSFRKVSAGPCNRASTRMSILCCWALAGAARVTVTLRRPRPHWLAGAPAGCVDVAADGTRHRLCTWSASADAPGGAVECEQSIVTSRRSLGECEQEPVKGEYRGLRFLPGLRRFGSCRVCSVPAEWSVLVESRKENA